MNKQLQAYMQLMRWDKPIGFLLLLWPTMWGLLIAGRGHISLRIFTIFVAGVFVMRSAGCVINDIADRKFDGNVARTVNRPLATGVLTTKHALVLFFVLCLVSFLLVLQLNMLSIVLSVFGLLFAVIYPFLKRITHLPQLGLGVAFAWGVPMAFAAQINQLPLTALVLFLIACIWPIAYDTMYAMVDREDDIRVGVKSTAILFGKYDVTIVMSLQCFVLLAFVILAIYLQLNIFFYITAVVASGFIYYQYQLIINGGSKGCFKAFLNNHWVGMVLAIGLFFGYW